MPRVDPTLTLQGPGRNCRIGDDRAATVRRKYGKPLKAVRVLILLPGLRLLLQLLCLARLTALEPRCRLCRPLDALRFFTAPSLPMRLVCLYKQVVILKAEEVPIPVSAPAAAVATAAVGA